MNDINQHIIDQLGSPRSSIIGIIATELTEIQSPLSDRSNGLVHNICRRLLKDSGDCISVPKEQLLASWDHTSVPREDLDQALDVLIAKNFLSSEHDFVRIKSNSLGKFIHAAIEADVTALSKVESMVAREFRSYQHNKRYLSQQEVNQVEPVFSRLFLPTDMHDFVNDSIAYRRRQRIRRNSIIVVIFIALSILTIVAFWQSNEASKYAAEVVRISDENSEIERQKREQLAVKSDSIQKLLLNNRGLLLSEQERADTEAEARREAELSRQDAERQRDSTARAKLIAENERNAAIKATQLAEEQTKIADAAKLDAISQSVEAELAKARAITAQENAEKLRSELLSVVLAEKSLSTPAGPSSDTMRAMVARVAFNVEAETHDDTTDHLVIHPKLYSSLYYGHKLLNRTSTHNADKIGNQPIHAMAFDAQNMTLHISHGIDGLKSMHFDHSLSDPDFDFPRVDSLYPNLRQPAHNLLLNEDQTILMTSGEFLLNTNLNSNVPSEHQIASGVKILNVIRFNKANEYLVLTSTNKLYKFNSTHGTFNIVPDINDVSHIAYIERLNILIYTTTGNQLYLVNFNKNISTHWGERGELSRLMIQDYGDKIFIVFGYLNGAVRVGITDAIELNAHDGENTRSMRSARMIETILSSNVHTGFVTDIDFAGNSHHMVVASGDGTASIWNLDAWAQRRTDYRPIILDDHEGWVTSCAIDSDENLVFTGTKRGVVKFWSMDPEYYADKICKALHERSFNSREWNIYIGNEVPFKKQICK